MVRRLEQLGAIVSVMPTVEVKELSDYGPLDRALANLASYQWLAFTSANGVHFFMRRLLLNGRDLRSRINAAGGHRPRHGRRLA